MTPPLVYFDGDPYMRDAEGEYVEQHHNLPTHTGVHA